MKRRLGFITLSLLVLLFVIAVATGAVGDAGGGFYRLVGLFGQVVGLVRSSYVQEVPISRLEMGAMDGLVTAGDPGGAWVPEESFAGFLAMKRRPVPAFGLVLGRRSAYPFVLQVLPGSPAAAAGIVVGELVERVGSEFVRARPTWQTELLLDGAERSQSAVEVEIIDRRLRWKRKVTIMPGAVSVPGPLVEMKDGIPVARMEVVDRESVRRITPLLAQQEGAPGVVVDLRGLALGSFEGAAEAAAVFSGGGVEVKLGRTGGGTEVVRAAGPPKPWRVVVCMDSTTGGAAEALALVLKGHGATLVGAETYGDTGRRRALAGQGGRVWLADSWCLDEKGEPLLGAGIRPDEVVRAREGEDVVLRRALEIARAGEARQAA